MAAGWLCRGICGPFDRAQRPPSCYRRAGKHSRRNAADRRRRTGSDQTGSTCQGRLVSISVSVFLVQSIQNLCVEIYNCADALVLASSREGWANVLLESMACGTPVLATAVWGTPEVVAVPEAGLLIERDARLHCRSHDASADQIPPTGKPRVAMPKNSTGSRPRKDR